MTVPLRRGIPRTDVFDTGPGKSGALSISDCTKSSRGISIYNINGAPSPGRLRRSLSQKDRERPQKKGFRGSGRLCGGASKALCLCGGQRREAPSLARRKPEDRERARRDRPGDPAARKKSEPPLFRSMICPNRTQIISNNPQRSSGACQTGWRPCRRRRTGRCGSRRG